MSALRRNEYRLLEEYSDCKKHPAGEISLVPLFDHDIKSDHHVWVEIAIAPFSHKFDVDIDATLTIKGIELRIKDARIRDITAGTLDGEGIISISSFQLLEKKFDPVKLPGRIHLKEGIAIDASYTGVVTKCKFMQFCVDEYKTGVFLFRIATKELNNEGELLGAEVKDQHVVYILT